MELRDVESTLPPGFRFYPNDEELVCHYLYKKVNNERTSEGTMVEVDLHTREPWELPEVAKLSANEWYFFSFRDRKYATGSRTNRATKSGYWKATGKDRTINDPGTRSMVGMRKTLVFYRGRAPNGIKTAWVMHEFRLETPHSPPKEDWVLCRVFHKRKLGEEEQDNGGSSSPTLRSSPPVLEQSVPYGYYEQMNLSLPRSHVLPHQDQDRSSSPFVNLALLQCNFLDFPQDVGSSAPMMGMNSSCDQHGQCGFFVDCSFEDHDKDEEVAGMARRIGGGRYQDQGIPDKFYF